MQDPTPEELARYFTTGEGRLTAAGMLWVTVLAFKRLPWLRDHFDRMLPLNYQKRIFTLVLSCLPVIAFALTSGMTFQQLALTAFTAFISATGLNRILTEIFPWLGAPPEKIQVEIKAMLEQKIPDMVKSVEDAVKK